MAIVVDATPASPTANSFTTLAKADLYLSGRLYATPVWTDAPADDKNRALVTATRLIVRAFQPIGWQGWPTAPSQRLPHPRNGVWLPNGIWQPNGVIPEALEDATAEYAYRLIEAGMLPDTPLDSEGIKHLKAGPVEIEFFAGGVGSLTELPDGVFEMIAFLSAQPGIGKTSVPLIRT